jgi:hypothetical protein
VVEFEVVRAEINGPVPQAVLTSCRERNYEKEGFYSLAGYDGV